MLFYRLLYVVVQIGLPLTADQYIGVCGSDNAHKYCVALSTLVRPGNSGPSSTFLVNDTYTNVVCPTNVQTAKPFPFPNDFQLYPFDLQCLEANISIFLPLDDAPMSYTLKPFHEVSGTSFSLLTECYIRTCRCIVINVNVTSVHIHTIASQNAPTIKTVPTNMKNVNQNYTMTNPLEMIVVTGSQQQLSNTYVNSNDSVTVFCVGDSVHATRGILQLPPLALSTTTAIAQLPLPTMSNTTYRTMFMPQHQTKQYIVLICLGGMISLNGSDQVPSDWYRYVPDFNSNRTYHLLGVTWSNVSGSSLEGQEARQYRNFTFRKIELVYRNLIMSSTTSPTVSSTNSATTVSYKATSSATNPARTIEPGIPSTTAVWNSSESLCNHISRPYSYIVGMCTYRCDSPVLPVNITDPVQRQMLQKLLKKLRKQLTVNKTKLSSTRRRKESAIDHRMSAKAVGLVGTAMLCTCVGVIILADLPKMSKIVHDVKAHVCKSDTIQVKQSKMRRPSRIRKRSEAKIVPFIQRSRVSGDTSV